MVHIANYSKRLQIYFRFNRELLGQLVKIAYDELIREVYQVVLGREDVVPGDGGGLRDWKTD